MTRTVTYQCVVCVCLTLLSHVTCSALPDTDRKSSKSTRLSQQPKVTAEQQYVLMLEQRLDELQQQVFLQQQQQHQFQQQRPWARSPWDPVIDRQSPNISLLLNALTANYDKRLRPNYKGGPVNVGITMFISAISQISEPNMDFTAEIYFRQYWTDERLQFNDSETLCISNEMLDKIWWPDTFFANAKKADFHHATTKNAFIRISPAGELTFSLRLTVIATCNMDFTFFPMDSQTCNIEIESYGFSTRDINYKWNDGLNGSVSRDPSIQLPTFALDFIKLNQTTQVLSTGNYTRLICQIFFSRNKGHYIIFIYIPSCLIVVISWVSFWLHVEASPARVALGITSVLTMTTLISSTNAALPKISYLKSVDVYLVTCYFYVFLTLIEFASVNFLTSRLKALQSAQQQQQQPPVVTSAASYLPPPPPPPLTNNTNIVIASSSPRVAEVRLKHINGMQTESDVKSGGCRAVALRLADAGNGVRLTERAEPRHPWYTAVCRRPVIIDECARKLFPLVFICFNVAYWAIYLHISEENKSRLLEQGP